MRVSDSASSCCALNSLLVNVITPTETSPAHVARFLSAPQSLDGDHDTWRESHRDSLIAYRNGLNTVGTQDSD